MHVCNLGITNARCRYILHGRTGAPTQVCGFYDGTKVDRITYSGVVNDLKPHQNLATYDFLPGPPHIYVSAYSRSYQIVTVRDKDKISSTQIRNFDGIGLASLERDNAKFGVVKSDRTGVTLSEYDTTRYTPIYEKILEIPDRSAQRIPITAVDKTCFFSLGKSLYNYDFRHHKCCRSIQFDNPGSENCIVGCNLLVSFKHDHRWTKFLTMEFGATRICRSLATDDLPYRFFPLRSAIDPIAVLIGTTFPHSCGKLYDVRRDRTMSCLDYYITPNTASSFSLPDGTTGIFHVKDYSYRILS